ncbi:hypothetical protein ACRRTK_017892 [Alexandromys fortis]
MFQSEMLTEKAKLQQSQKCAAYRILHIQFSQELLGLSLVSFPKGFKSWQSQASICCSLNNGDEVKPISFSIILLETLFVAQHLLKCLLNIFVASNLFV